MPNLKQSLQAMMLSGLGLSLALPVYAITADQNTEVNASVAGVNASAQVNTSADTGALSQGVQNLGQGIKNLAVKTGDVVSNTTANAIDGTKTAAAYVGDKAHAGWDKTVDTTIAAKDATIEAKDATVEAGANVAAKTVTGVEHAGHVVADKSNAVAEASLEKAVAVKEAGLEKAEAAKDATVDTSTKIATKAADGTKRVAKKATSATKTGVRKAANKTSAVAHKAVTTTKAAKDSVKDSLSKTAGSAQLNQQTSVNGQVGSHSAHLDSKTSIKTN